MSELSVKNISNNGFTLEVGEIPSSVKKYDVTTKVTLADGSVIQNTKTVQIKAVLQSATIQGSTTFTAKNGVGSANYTFSTTPSAYNVGELVSVVSSNSAVVVSNATKSGFTLSVNGIEADATSTITAQFSAEGNTITATYNVTARYVEVVTPFILYNGGTETASISICRSNVNVPNKKLYYAVVDDFIEEEEEYDDSNVEYSIYENSGSDTTIKVADVPVESALLLKTYEKAKWNLNENGCANFVMSGNNIKAYGDISSLDGYKNEPYNGRFATMFIDCTSLTVAPKLPAITLNQYCYKYMFSGCTSLTTAPELPATTLVSNCYQYMFSGCTSLTTAPELPATTVPSYCYCGMFQGCTSLTTAPELPSENINWASYDSMFDGCTSLTQAPDLPSKSVPTYCYGSMFRNCSSLVNAPKISATSFSSNSATAMFKGCTSLTQAPDLLNLKLGESAIDSMFFGCTSLKVAPKIHITSISSTSCMYMFKGCTSLTSVPMLACDSSASSASFRDFVFGCSNLTYIKTRFKSGQNIYFENWTTGVPSNGTILKTDGTTLSFGYYGVPVSWSVRNYNNVFEYDSRLLARGGVGTFVCDIEEEYQGKITSVTTNNSSVTCSDITDSTFTLVANGLTADSTIDVSVVAEGNTITNSITISYLEKLEPFILFNGGETNSKISLIRSKENVPMTKMYYAVVDDYVEGEEYDDSSVGYSLYNNTIASYGVMISEVPSGSALLLKAYDKARLSTSGNIYSKFSIIGSNIKAYGSIGSLDGYGNMLADYCYYGMFQGCTSLTTAPELPATTLGSYCYCSMFQGCTSLTTAPELPSTTMKSYCYNLMFQDCRTLTVAPELPATTLANYCYASMFKGCTSLTAAPELPATTLAGYCYADMFYQCNTLTVAPELPATTLASYCYGSMFYGCASLTTAPELPATTLVSNCYQYMFSGCTSLTTAPELPATTLVSNCYQYMFYGCASLTTAPELPATTLVSNCYVNMFNNCRMLNYIKALFITTPSSSCTSNWIQGVSSSGTFVKNYLAEWDVVGDNGIPSGWTVEINAELVSYDNLAITADDVSGRKSMTTIHCSLECTMRGEDGETFTYTKTWNDVSADFGTNTSETEERQVEISYTHEESGLSATTTITQGVWVNKSYTVDLNSQWRQSTDIANPDSSTYDGVYESFSNYNVSNANAIMKINIVGYEKFEFYIRSYAEGGCDYVVVSNLDATSITRTTSGVKAHTSGNQQGGTAITNYTKVTFDNLDGGEHQILVLYGKDGSVNSGTDRGYVLIPKNQ